MRDAHADCSTHWRHKGQLNKSKEADWVCPHADHEMSVAISRCREFCAVFANGTNITVETYVTSGFEKFENYQKAMTLLAKKKIEAFPQQSEKVQ